MTAPRAMAWPREIAHLGRLRIMAFERCAECAEHTWAFYGQTPLCLTHARARATNPPPPPPALDGQDLGW